MTAQEFVLVLAWVLFPPDMLAIGVLLALHGMSESRSRSRSRTIGAVLILLVASVCFSLVMVVAPPGLGLGIRDEPIMWAPFAFIAVAFALPMAVWWSVRGQSRRH